MPPRFEQLLRSAVSRLVLAGSALGAVSLPPLLALLAAEGFGGSNRLARLAALGGTTLILALVVLGVWMATAAVLRHETRGLTRRESLRRAAFAWWPATAFAPVLASVPLGLNAAHRFLFEPNDGRIFTLYVGFWLVVMHAGIIGGAILRRRALRAQPAPVPAPVTEPTLPAAVPSGTLVKGVSGADTPHPYPASAQVPQRDPYALHGIWLVLATAVTFTAFLNWGLIQQLTAKQGEFQSHFVAARVMMRGVSPYQLERDVWAQINVPPVTLALVYAPWIPLPDVPRHILYGILHVSAFAAALTLLLRRLISRTMPAVTVALAVILIGSIYAPWRESFWLGQPNGFIFFSLTLALLAIFGRRWMLAGALATVSLVFKPVGGWILLYLLVARRYRALVGGAITGLLLLAVSFPFIPSGIWQIWLTEKAPFLLKGTTHHTSISLPVLHARLFLTSNAYYLAVPPPDSPLVGILNTMAMLSSLLLLFVLVRPHRDPSDRGGQALEYSLAVVLALMLSPLTWLHYATAALIAFVSLVDVCRERTIPISIKRVVAALGILAFGLLSIDQELLLLRTAAMWERFTLLGSISNAGLPLLAAAVSILLWTHDHPVRPSWTVADTGGSALNLPEADAKPPVPAERQLAAV